MHPPSLQDVLLAVLHAAGARTGRTGADGNVWRVVRHDAKVAVWRQVALAL